MQVFKNISFSIALFLIGALFLLLGLAVGIPIGDGSFVLQDIWSRGLAFLIGFLFVGLAIYIETKLKSQTKSVQQNQRGSVKTSIDPMITEGQAESFFYTLDDEKPTDNFPNLIQNANRVSILCRTAVNLLSQYHRVFADITKGGCEIRLLFVDPSSDACKFLYGDCQEVYHNNISTTTSHLKALKKQVGNYLSVKVTKHAPTLSMIIIEKQDASQSFARVQLYFLHSRVGRDRPIFRINYGDKWYRVFMEEFNQLWSDGKDWKECNG